jgi:hypothetical protein
MAGGNDTTAADKLKDVIEDLRHGKGKKSDVNVYEDEFQDSFEQTKSVNNRRREPHIGRTRFRYEYK